MQRARLGSGSGGPDEVEDGMVCTLSYYCYHYHFLIFLIFFSLVILFVLFLLNLWWLVNIDFLVCVAIEIGVKWISI